MIVLHLFYLAIVTAASGLVGLFVQQVMAGQGYVVGYDMGVALAVGAGSGYAALQFVYMTMASLYKPAQGKSFLAADGASQLAALALLPYLFHVHVKWPIPELAKAEPLAYLAVFLAVHAALKLFSFFTALQSAPGNHSKALLWAACAAMSGYCGMLGFSRWSEALELARPNAPETIEAVRVGNEYASARAMPEGSVVETEVAGCPGAGITLRWANPPNTPEPLKRIFVTVTLRGIKKKSYQYAVAMRPSGWAALQIDTSNAPQGVGHCLVTWTAEKLPKWRSIIGLRPVVQSTRSILLSGPYVHTVRTDPEDHANPNIVIIALDGLSYGQMGRGGYKRVVTPNLDKLAWSSLFFSNAYTVAPEGAAAYWSMATGLNPLRHGRLGGHSSPLPEPFATLAEVCRNKGYATAAFTEGDSHGDLTYGSGFERGFEVFDASYQPDKPNAPAAVPAPPVEPSEEEEDAFELPSEEPEMEAAAEPEAEERPEPSAQPAGSRLTLNNAQEWLDSHNNLHFMLFIRLSELTDQQLQPRYGAPFGAVSSASGSVEPSPLDIHDTILAYLDRQAGAFIKHVRDYETRKNTIIVVTSPYGYDFSLNGPPKIGLSEACLHVPLILYAQWLGNEQRTDFVSLEDIAPSLLAQADTPFAEPVDGQDFVKGPNGVMPVSMESAPLAMTMRNERWRLYWNTGRTPFESGAPNGAESIELYDLDRAGRYGVMQDVSSRYTDRVNLWRRKLQEMLDLHDQYWLRH